MSTDTSTEKPLSLLCHGSTIFLDDEGITVKQHSMSSSLIGSEFHTSYSDLLGWRYEEPHSASLGWIQLLSPGTDLSIHRCAIMAENMIRFAPSHLSLFRLLHHFLIQIQSGELSPTQAREFLISALQNNAGDDGSLPATVATAQDPLHSPAQASLSHGSAASTASSSTKKKSAPKRKQWKAISTPDEIPEPNKDADIDHPLFGKNVTITGDFSPYEKGEIWAMIAHHGGVIGKNVTKKTQIVVIGQWDSMTSKEKRARELQDQGQDIQLWSAAEFLASVGTVDDTTANNQ